MIDKDIIINLAEEFLKDSLNYLIDVSINPGNSILVEIDNDEGVNIDDCANLSRAIENELDRETEDFELTVTSAGLTSPLRNVRQYRKYEGKEIETLTKDSRKLTGVLKTPDDEGFVINIGKKVKPEGAKRKIEVREDLRFAYDEVKYTKYLIQFK